MRQKKMLMPTPSASMKRKVIQKPVGLCSAEMPGERSGWLGRARSVAHHGTYQNLRSPSGLPTSFVGKPLGLDDRRPTEHPLGLASESEPP